MSQADGRIGRIDTLAAVSGSPHDIDPDILIRDIDIDIIIHLRHDGDGDGGGMNPAAGFRGRHALDPVDPAFIFKSGIGSLARDHEVDIFHAADPDLFKIQGLRLPAPGFGVMDVHPVDFGGEQGRFIAAGPRPDLHNDVLLIIGVFGDQQDLQLFLQAVQLLFGAADLLPGQLAHLFVVFLLQEHPGFLQIIRNTAETGIGLHQRSQVALFLHQPAETSLVGQDTGTGQLPVDIFIS